MLTPWLTPSLLTIVKGRKLLAPAVVQAKGQEHCHNVTRVCAFVQTQPLLSFCPEPCSDGWWQLNQNVKCSFPDQQCWFNSQQDGLTYVSQQWDTLLSCDSLPKISTNRYQFKRIIQLWGPNHVAPSSVLPFWYPNRPFCSMLCLLFCYCNCL